MKTVLVAGTWGDYQENGWWRPGSAFAREAERNGLQLLDPDDPFRWPSDLEGVWGKNRRWELAGHFLRWYCHAKAPWEPVNIIAHSHGGQVAAYAITQGLRIRTLITVATPVRADMEAIYHAIWCPEPLLYDWIHIHTDHGDRWQWLGALGDGLLGVRREMPFGICNICEPGRDHTSLLDPALWTERGWWECVEAGIPQGAAV